MHTPKEKDLVYGFKLVFDKEDKVKEKKLIALGIVTRVFETQLNSFIEIAWLKDFVEGYRKTNKPQIYNNCEEICKLLEKAGP